MKKLLTLLFCFGIVGLHAQTFTFTPRTAFSSGANTSIPDVAVTMQNNAASSADSMFKLTIIKTSPPSAWQITFCDPENCYPTMNLSQTQTFKVRKGQTGQLKATYVFNSTGGIDTAKIYVESLLNPSNHDTATLIVYAWMTGISEAGRSAEMTFYPNPAKDVLNFKYPVSSPVNIDIYNVIGVKVKSFTHDGKVSLVNISDLKDGVYFIRFRDGNAVHSKTFTKAK